MVNSGKLVRHKVLWKNIFFGVSLDFFQVFLVFLRFLTLFSIFEGLKDFGILESDFFPWRSLRFNPKCKR